MAWNETVKPLMAGGVGGKHTVAFLYDYNYHPFPGGHHQAGEVERTHLSNNNNHNSNSNSNSSNNNSAHDENNNHAERKRRMRWDQIESLERSFQEEIKLEPERKIKLAQELGLQPRKVAVWFQNRHARWKAKQLERLYDSLKQEFDIVSREKLKLQEEVMKLKMKLDHQAQMIQGSRGSTDVLMEPEETVESKSVVISNSSTMLQGATYHQTAGDCNYTFNLDDYIQGSLPYMGILHGYPNTY
ncbi:hypothetical protein C5167_033792 [Papaver somniferum]|uniref:Homeobox-leucine zipper protein n=1 Tax=Papaver somniferum TaxID=3469 RepID=A0A4Y7KFD5_PAPSO|nr:putative homeobox-leucine zipper protein ATHB-51 [Papaver somniferum]XP_026397631.1 putative homeobox-leucine zipper protein ATHB-51 [Papaver somniferum]RZC70625.1 hypothetical protein C5167_033792 [Papaver somniferum]